MYYIEIRNEIGETQKFGLYTEDIYSIQPTMNIIKFYTKMLEKEKKQNGDNKSSK